MEASIDFRPRHTEVSHLSTSSVFSSSVFDDATCTTSSVCSSTPPDLDKLEHLSNENLIATVHNLCEEIQDIRSGSKDLCLRMEKQIQSLRQQLDLKLTQEKDMSPKFDRSSIKPIEPFLPTSVTNDVVDNIEQPITMLPSVGEPEFPTCTSFSPGVSFFAQSSVLTTMWIEITQNSDAKAEWYLTEYCHTIQEKNDPIYNDVLNLLSSETSRQPGLLLSDFLVSNMVTIKSYIDHSSLRPLHDTPPLYQTATSPLYQTATSPLYQTATSPLYQTTTSQLYQTDASPLYQTAASPLYQTATSPLKQETSQTDQICTATELPSNSPVCIVKKDKVCNFRRFNDTIASIWQDFYYGREGHISIRDLEREKGTKWRSGGNSALSKAYGRRKSIYTFIVFGIKECGMTAEEIIEWLDKYANDGVLVKKRASLTWFLRNQQKATLALYKVRSLGKVDILNDY